MSEERSTRIVVNGQEYHGVEEMPPEVRSLYEQALALAADQAPGTASPHPASALPPAPAVTHVTVNKVTTTRKYVVNGREYASLEELPPDVAEQVERAMASAGVEVIQGAATPAPATRPARPAARIPNFDEPQGARLRMRVSALRLALWIGAILLIILLYMRRH